MMKPAIGASSRDPSVGFQLHKPSNNPVRMITLNGLVCKTIYMARLSNDNPISWLNQCHLAVYVLYFSKTNEKSSIQEDFFVSRRKK